VRKAEVAAQAGVPVAQVQAVTVDQVRTALADRVPETVLEVATQEPAHYWLAGGRYWLDDPYFGEVVAFDDLAYSSEIGLHRISA
jgi:hypothetical protein